LHHRAMRCQRLGYALDAFLDRLLRDPLCRLRQRDTRAAGERFGCGIAAEKPIGQHSTQRRACAGQYRHLVGQLICQYRARTYTVATCGRQNLDKAWRVLELLKRDR